MRWKTICKKILFPPPWVMLLLSIASSAALIAVFREGLEESPIAYFAYVIAFYTLVVVCVFCGIVFPRWYRKVKEKIYETQYGNRYMTDVTFKTHVTLYLSLLANLLYVGVNIFLGLSFETAWFLILAGYYTILAIMRFLLVRYMGKTKIGTNRLGELKRSRLCAMILITLNLILSGAVLMILYQNKGYEYPGMLIYVAAMYTFYITTHAIIDIIRYRKYKSPVMTTAKIINLTAALVSMLTLETAMFSAFGYEMAPSEQRVMIAATGAGISLAVIAMSAYLIAAATKQIKKITIENAQIEEK